MATKLTAITDTAELRALQELYLKDWPQHCVGYFWLDNYLRWLNKDPQIKHLTFYTLNGDWQRDGLFLLVVRLWNIFIFDSAKLLLWTSFQHRYQLFFSNISRERTPELVRALRLLDWSRGFKVSAIHETHHAIYKFFLAERQLRMDREMKTIMYHMPFSKAKMLHINCPTGYYVDSVRVEHAELINDLWSARHVGSLKLIQLLIEHNTNIGLYDQESGELCAWCLR